MSEFSPRAGQNVFVRQNSMNFYNGELSPANYHRAHGASNWIENHFLPAGYNSQEVYNPLREVDFPKEIDEVTLEKLRAQREYALRLSSNQPLDNMLPNYDDYHVFTET